MLATTSKSSIELKVTVRGWTHPGRPPFVRQNVISEGAQHGTSLILSHLSHTNFGVTPTFQAKFVHPCCKWSVLTRRVKYPEGVTTSTGPNPPHRKKKDNWRHITQGIHFCCCLAVTVLSLQAAISDRLNNRTKTTHVSIMRRAAMFTGGFYLSKNVVNIEILPPSRTLSRTALLWVISCRRFGTTYSDCWLPWRLKRIGYPETSAINHHYSLRNNPGQRSSNPLQWRNPKIPHGILSAEDFNRSDLFQYIQYCQLWLITASCIAAFLLRIYSRRYTARAYYSPSDRLYACRPTELL